MIRSILSIIVGFLAWSTLWFGGEKILSALLPDAFGSHQLAFETALTSGTTFAPPASFLLMHIVLCIIVSLMTGLLTAVIAGENRRAPLIVAFLLLGLGVLKAVLSWQYVPVWYHVSFTVLMFVMTIAGGKLRTTKQAGSA